MTLNWILAFFLVMWEDNTRCRWWTLQVDTCNLCFLTPTKFNNFCSCLVIIISVWILMFWQKLVDTKVTALLCENLEMVESSRLKCMLYTISLMEFSTFSKLISLLVYTYIHSHTTKVPQSSTLVTCWLSLSETVSCLCRGVKMHYINASLIFYRITWLITWKSRD